MHQVLKKVLLLSKGVSDKLQSEGLDVVSGCERVTDLLTAVKALRCDVKFEEFWVATLEKCAKLGIKEPKEKRPHKLPRRLDENPDSAVQVSVKDNFNVFFYYNVSFQTIHYIVINVLVTVSFTMVLSLYFRYWTL